MKLVDAPGKVNTGRPLKPVGIAVHHTASNRNANPDNVVAMCVRGVNKVPGPLYNYLIKRDGTIMQLTAENVKANHAGRGMGSIAGPAFQCTGRGNDCRSFQQSSRHVNGTMRQ